MNFKRFLSFVLAGFMLFAASGCKQNPTILSSGDTTPSQSEITKKTKRNYLTLLYSSFDSFNPYNVQTDVNRHICKLLYEPLIKVSDDFEPINALAKAVNNKGKTYKITIKSAKFSDGTAVSADDVKYSYNLAKKENTAYSKKLSGVKSVSADGLTVTFNLKKNDPYFANVLDFPIIKEGSEKRTDSDGVILPPIGCGRYKLNKTRDGLVKNKKYFGKSGAISEIRLIDAPDSASIAHYIEIGAADIYFSEISDGTIMRMSAERKEINLNNLVYIGINRNNAALKHQQVRQAISAAIDRTKICEEGYYNNALPATGFFHPEWEQTKSVQNLQIKTNSEIAIENLKEIGYNKLNTSGSRRNTGGTQLKFTLLVNSDNRNRVLAAQAVAKQLKAVGIDVTVVKKKFSAYKAALKKGDFQLYLGEVRVSENMDVSPLFLKGGSVAYGLPKVAEKKEDKISDTESTTSSKSSSNAKTKTTSSQVVINQFYKGKATVQDVASVLQTEMPIVPVCYRTGVLFYNKKISNVDKSSRGDIYLSIDSYLIN